MASYKEHPECDPGAEGRLVINGWACCHCSWRCGHDLDTRKCRNNKCTHRICNSCRVYNQYAEFMGFVSIDPDSKIIKWDWAEGWTPWKYATFEDLTLAMWPERKPRRNKALKKVKDMIHKGR